MQIFPAELERLAAAAVDLEAKTGFTPTGRAGLCLKATEGIDVALEEASSAIADLPGARSPRQSTDAYGYHWLLVEGEDLASTAAQVRLVLGVLDAAGQAGAVACAPFSFQATGRGALYLVFLPARGGFYPFIPSGAEQRDSQLELTIAADLRDALAVEGELERWFPIYGCPVDTSP